MGGRRCVGSVFDSELEQDGLAADQLCTHIDAHRALGVELDDDSSGGVDREDDAGARRAGDAAGDSVSPRHLR